MRDTSVMRVVVDRALSVLLLISLLAVLTAIAPLGAGAQTNSGPISQVCDAVPEHTPLSVVEAGVRGTVGAERVVVTNDVALVEGEYFQQSIDEPDGSVFYSSLLLSLIHI